MATWQYDIHFLPREAAPMCYKSISSASGISEINTDDWWQHYEHVKDLADALSHILPGAKSWSSEVQMWGTDDGDRIDLSWNEDQTLISDIFLRIDVRQFSFAFLREIVRIANEHHLMILTEDMRLIEPTLRTLTEAIRASPASRFVKDPQLFLTDLEKRRS